MIASTPRPPLDKAFLDAVRADAEGQRDNSKFLANDPHAWKVGLATCLDDVRSELTSVNAERSVNHPRTYKRHLLEQRRADLAGSQASLETRLRYVKTLCAGVPAPTQTSLLHAQMESESPYERMKAHLYAALDLIKVIEKEASTD